MTYWLVTRRFPSRRCLAFTASSLLSPSGAATEEELNDRISRHVVTSAQRRSDGFLGPSLVKEPNFSTPIPDFSPPFVLLDDGLDQGSKGSFLTQQDLNGWFVSQVLPFEGVLERYLRRNCRDVDEVVDLRQETYVRVYNACAHAKPESIQAFLLLTAKNLLIDRARRAQIVSIETFADLDALEPLVDEVTPERNASARGELRVLQAALELLPARCREVIELRKIDGMSQREVAARMGITEDTVERQVGRGIRALAQALRLVTGDVLKPTVAAGLPGKGRTTK